MLSPKPHLLGPRTSADLAAYDRSYGYRADLYPPSGEAIKQLRAKLYELELQNRRAEQQAIEDSKADIGWGSQIRSYVLHPYQMVKDHRTNYEKGNVQAVLDGEIDEFIEEYLRKRGSGMASTSGGD